MQDGTRADIREKERARRVGLEQEFFLVDGSGALRHEADLFLSRCRGAAGGEGIDPRCFKKECAKSLVELTTPPCSSFEDLVGSYLRNLRLALEAARGLGLRLYPLGTYPLPTSPVVRDDPRYRLKARVIGHERFLHAGRCAGVHLHIELPPGTVFPDVKVARKAPPAARRELLDVYNLATALVALTRACPFYEGRVAGLAARTAWYRGVFGVDGVYARLPEVGALQPYAGSVEDLIWRQTKRYRAWFRAMDEAGVDRRLFARTAGNLYRASWNPVRINPKGTVEIRSMDGNYPEVVLAVCALVIEAVARVRRERLRVKPAPGVHTLEVDGGTLLVPDFAYLNGNLLHAAVTGGAQDPRIVAYLDSFFEFATYRRAPEHASRLRSSSGAYRTTETEVLRAFPPSGSSLAREEGLRLVRESCRRLEEEASHMYRRYHRTPLPGEKGEARPIREDRFGSRSSTRKRARS